jgi:heme A synthase
MKWNKWIRQTHRWLSIAFTLAVVINGVAVVQRKYNNKLGLMAVAVLALEFLSGMYLFVLPYAAKWRGRGQRASVVN